MEWLGYIWLVVSAGTLCNALLHDWNLIRNPGWGYGVKDWAALVAGVVAAPLLWGTVIIITSFRYLRSKVWNVAG